MRLTHWLAAVIVTVLSGRRGKRRHPVGAAAWVGLFFGLGNHPSNRPARKRGRTPNGEQVSLRRTIDKTERG